MKLLELLTKEPLTLSDDCKFIAQDPDKDVYQYTNDNLNFDGHTWNTVGYPKVNSSALLQSREIKSVLADDYATAVISRDDYLRAVQLVKDGYALWFGGECPVDGDVVVDCILNKGARLKHSLSEDITWSHLNEAGDVIAYKVVESPSVLVAVGDNNIEALRANGWTDPQIVKANRGEYKPAFDPFSDTPRCIQVPLTVKYTAPDFLEKGAQHMRDRAAQRDTPNGERSMKRTVEAFNAMFGHNLTETEGWRFMEFLKISRSINGFNADDYEDGAAYAALAGEAHSNEK